MDPTLVVTMADQEFKIGGVSVQEMIKVKAWTRLATRELFYQGVIAEDPEALLAAYCLARLRAGDKVSYADDDFDLDELGAKLVDDTGRAVEPVVETNRDGTVKTGKDGAPIAVLDTGGRRVWRYADTGEHVPPAATDSTTS